MNVQFVHVHVSYYYCNGEGNDEESGLGYWYYQRNHTLYGPIKQIWRIC